LEVSVDRFDAIRTLLAAIDGGSLSAASRRLGMPLPTVSRKISELEAHLGAPLLLRTSRKLVLTEAGQGFAAAGRRVLDTLLEAEREAAGEYRTPRGELLVTASLMFGKSFVVPTLLDFAAQFPEVTVRCLFSDQVIDLVENHVDAAIRIGRLPDSALVARRVGQTRWMVCASPDYLARRGTPGTPEDLRDHECIAFEGLDRVRQWPFAGGGAPRMVDIRARMAGNTAEAIIAAAEAGLGIARLLSYQAGPALAAGRLIAILRAHEPEPMPVHLVHAGPAILPLKLRSFLEFVAPRLRARLASLPGSEPAAGAISTGLP